MCRIHMFRRPGKATLHVNVIHMPEIQLNRLLTFWACIVYNGSDSAFDNWSQWNNNFASRIVPEEVDGEVKLFAAGEVIFGV